MEEIKEQRKGGVKIEIADMDQSSSCSNTVESQKSLAEIFKERRGLAKADADKPKEKRPEKSKEELAEIRKQMMKHRPNNNNSSQPSLNQSSLNNADSSLDSAKLAKNSELMQRLARGQKVEVSKKDMLKLTSKNYEQLPEVRKKREDERKKEEMRERMRQVKEIETKRRELRSAGNLPAH